MASSYFMTQSQVSPDPRRPALIASLRSRYDAAEQEGDATAKQALFREAVYLGIKPEEFIPSP
ncbi:MAG: hypothetical protein AAFX65_09770 [Cyanobacteria bacterium J06638_7]